MHLTLVVWPPLSIYYLLKKMIMVGQEHALHIEYCYDNGHHINLCTLSCSFHLNWKPLTHNVGVWLTSSV